MVWLSLKITLFIVYAVNNSQAPVCSEWPPWDGESSAWVCGGKREGERKKQNGRKKERAKNVEEKKRLQWKEWWAAEKLDKKLPSESQNRLAAVIARVHTGKLSIDWLMIPGAWGSSESLNFSLERLGRYSPYRYHWDLHLPTAILTEESNELSRGSARKVPCAQHVQALVVIFLRRKKCEEGWIIDLWENVTKVRLYQKDIFKSTESCVLIAYRITMGIGWKNSFFSLKSFRPK